MITLTPKYKMAALLCGIAFLNLSLFALGGEMKDADSSKQNRIEIKDFAFNPKTLTVKSGEKITWINHDRSEERRVGKECRSRWRQKHEQNEPEEKNTGAGEQQAR